MKQNYQTSLKISHLKNSIHNLPYFPQFPTFPTFPASPKSFIFPLYLKTPTELKQSKERGAQNTIMTSKRDRGTR